MAETTQPEDEDGQSRVMLMEQVWGGESRASM